MLPIVTIFLTSVSYSFVRQLTCVPHTTVKKSLSSPIVIFCSYDTPTVLYIFSRRFQDITPFLMELKTVFFAFRAKLKEYLIPFILVVRFICKFVSYDNIFLHVKGGLIIFGRDIWGTNFFIARF